MPSPSSTLVIGGGIVGLATAYELARRGHAVTVLERDTIDTGASTGNAGIIALGHPPLPRPGLVGQTLKLLFKRTNPLYVKPRLDRDLLRWFLDFRRACSAEQYAKSMEILAELGRATGACFRRLVEEEKIDAEYRPAGWIEVFRTESGFRHGRAGAEEVRGYGFDAEVYDGAELRRREPCFNDSVVGAVRYPDSAMAHPRKFTVGLAEAATRHGAEIRTGVEVARIDLDGDRTFRGVETTTGERVEADALVLAAGVWTTALARAIGVNVPMQAGKGYHVEIGAPDPPPSTTCVLAETFVACTPIGGGLRLAGTVELSGINHRLVRRRLDMLRVGARAYFDAIDESPPRAEWCGLRPCTADGLPAIGPAPGVGGVHVATGHAMMGFALGPVTGKLISEMILDDGRTSIDVTPLRVDRFE